MFRFAVLAISSTLAPAAAQASTINLIAQPNVVGSLASIFEVSTVKPNLNPIGQFFVKQNQNVKDGQKDVPTDWSAGDRTGFYPPGRPLTNWQLGIAKPQGGPNNNEVTQGEGNTIGAYITSGAFPHGTHLNKVMVAPQYAFDLKHPVFPFAHGGAVLSTNFDLQVPYAHSDSKDRSLHPFVVSDLTFAELDGKGNPFNRFQLHAGAFSNGQGGGGDNVSYDHSTRTIKVDADIGPGSAYLTPLKGSASFSGSPWSGFRHFGFTQSYDQFARGLSDARKSYPQLSNDPGHYVLVQWHLNAELTYNPSRWDQPVDMGWSLRGFRLDLTQ